MYMILNFIISTDQASLYTIDQCITSLLVNEAAEGCKSALIIIVTEQNISKGTNGTITLIEQNNEQNTSKDAATTLNEPHRAVNKPSIIFKVTTTKPYMTKGTTSTTTTIEQNIK